MTTIKITPQPKRSRNLERVSEDNPLLSLRNNIDKMFDSFFRGFDIVPFGTGASIFNPNIDVADTGKEIKVNVELPGMDDKDIDVSLTKDSLTIRGEKKDETQEESTNYHRMERVYGYFSRVIPLPVDIDVNRAKASYKNGVLTINLPKTEASLKEAKKIPIKAENK
ncbi:MAG: Hsp20/alpha crystallin family protein [Syntrophorhabdaceae bacterium]